MTTSCCPRRRSTTIATRRSPRPSSDRVLALAQVGVLGEAEEPGQAHHRHHALADAQRFPAADRAHVAGA